MGQLIFKGLYSNDVMQVELIKNIYICFLKNLIFYFFWLKCADFVKRERVYMRGGGGIKIYKLNLLKIIFQQNFEFSKSV